MSPSPNPLTDAVTRAADAAVSVALDTGLGVLAVAAALAVVAAALSFFPSLSARRHPAATSAPRDY